MPQATSKPVEVTYLPITTNQEMFDALLQAPNIAYQGSIELTLNAEGAGVLVLKLAGPAQSRIEAALGQVLVWNGTTLASLGVDDFLARYTPVG